MKRYEANRAVIIGGTSGMGLATAKMLLDGGARVLVTGRSQAGLDSARKELGEGALVVSSDARSLTDLDALASLVKTEFDTFDLLFVNAGFSIPTRLESVTEAIRPAGEATDNGKDDRLDPDAIASTYLHLLTQPRNSWSWEIEVRPWVERF